MVPTLEGGRPRPPEFSGESDRSDGLPHTEAVCVFTGEQLHSRGHSAAVDKYHRHIRRVGCPVVLRVNDRRAQVYNVIVPGRRKVGSPNCENLNASVGALGVPEPLKHVGISPDGVAVVSGEPRSPAEQVSAIPCSVGTDQVDSFIQSPGLNHISPIQGLPRHSLLPLRPLGSLRPRVAIRSSQSDWSRRSRCPLRPCRGSGPHRPLTAYRDQNGE